MEIFRKEHTTASAESKPCIMQDFFTQNSIMPYQSPLRGKRLHGICETKDQLHGEYDVNPGIQS